MKSIMGVRVKFKSDLDLFDKNTTPLLKTINLIQFIRINVMRKFLH